jgi:hypothetical protein
MSRIQKLENIYKEQLINHNIDNVSVFLQSIINADITKGKYTRFLIESFLNDKFLEEDLIGGLNSTVGQAMSLFDKHKSKLPENMRSVYALNLETQTLLYQSPGDLWNSVKQFQGELSGKELKKEEQEQVYRETEFIYQDEETGFQIVSPLTEESAKWWGKGTRWCTSAEKNNMFERYNKKAPLLIVLIPNHSGTGGNGDKLQLWKNDNNIQFMDELDNNVALDYIEQNWKFLEPICLWLNNIRFIPYKYKTKELCEMAVRNDGYSLQYVPEELKTKEMCELAIEQNGMALQHVPEELGKKYFYDKEAKKNGEYLRFIPDEYITKEMCESAFQQDIQLYKDFPEHFKTYQYSLILIKNNSMLLCNVPEKLRTKELCELAVQQNGNSLQYIPMELRTFELCKLAVQNGGNALKFVPKQYQTYELCELAIQQNGLALEYVSNKIKNITLCREAIKQNGMALEYVPISFFPKSNKQTLLKYFFNNKDKNILTKKDFYNAVEQNGESLRCVPHEYITKEMCELAVKQLKVNILYCNKDYRVNNQNLIRKLLDENEISIAYIYNSIIYDNKRTHWNEVLHSFHKEYSDLSDLITEYQNKKEVKNNNSSHVKKINFEYTNEYNEIRELFYSNKMLKKM